MDQAGDRNEHNVCCRNKEPINGSLLIKKSITLVEHQVTKNDIARQKEKIQEYLAISKNGFMIIDLADVMYLIELLVERIYISDYMTLLEEILNICFIPPVLTKSSDVLTYAKDVQHYFTMLCYFLVYLEHGHLKKLLACALINLITMDLPEERNYLSLDARKKYVISSHLPEIISQFLPLADESIYSKILHIVHLLTENSGVVCEFFLVNDALNTLITRLEPTWKDRYPDVKPQAEPIDNVLYYEDSSNIIGTLLDYLSNNKNKVKGVKNITVFSLWSLQYVYRLFVTRTHKALYRNNALIIIIKLMELFPNMDFVKSGLAVDLISSSLSPLYIKTSWAPKIRLTLSDSDYTFLQLLLCIVPRYVQFLGGIRLLEDYRITQRLLKHTINSHTVVWPQPQVCVISIAALDVMKKIVPFIEDEFIENAGPTIMLGILQKHQVKDSDINVLKKCLETLNHILKNSASNLTLNSIIFNDGEKIILDLCENILSQPIDQKIKEKSLGFAFCVLSSLYKHVPPKNITPLIDLSIKFMKQVLHSQRHGRVHDTRVIICLMDFTWEHIFTSEESSLEFVRKNGVFLMLDIIQTFPFVVQLVTLGALVDLCEYGHCIPYLITWRGNGQRITPLLMKLFREENERLKVKTKPNGDILDIKYPLMGQKQWIETYCGCKHLTGNPVCADLFVSCRPKIYAILQMLNVRYADMVEIADDHYKSYNYDDLEAKDQVTLLLAENFLALKLGEAWVELKTEFENIPNLSLTRVDEKITSSIIDRSRKWVTYLQKLQNDILENAHFKDLIEEQNLYNNMQEGRLSEALQALADLKYIARSTERMFRVSQKFIRNGQIEKSLKLSTVDVCPQKTYFAQICVTPVFSHHVNVESKVGRHTEPTVILPISPTVSNNECDIDLPEDLLLTPSDIHN